MLSCKDVRAHLAAVEAGEPAPGELRDHLASCDACRTEAASVRADLETLRSGLASLAPSPFLEDAVLEAARGEHAAPRSKRAWWLPAGIGIAAAAVLAVLVFVAKLPGAGEHAAGDGEPTKTEAGGPSLVDIPPTAAQVTVERKARLAKTRIMTELRFDILGVPPPGMAVVGRMLLTRLGPKREGYAGAKIAFDRLTKGGRSQEIDITVGAPGWKGAVARVRARVVLEYTGNLILEETLARALGLHAFEVPGGVTVGGDYGMAGEQSRASIRIGGQDLETNVEVLHEHVPLPAVPIQSGGVPQAMRIEIRGARPDNGHTGKKIALHHDHGTSFVIADVTMGWRNDGGQDAELGMLKQGPLQAALSYHAGRHPECIVFLPSLDIGGGGPLAWAFRLERVTLRQTFEPGAMVTIARVWRGRTAIPSRESVAHTWAAKDGHVSFVHVRGERGPLRAREVRKDGTVHWHELQPPSSNPRHTIMLEDDGTVTCNGYIQFPLFKRRGTDDHTPQADARKALGDYLAGLAGAGRDGRGTSLITVALYAPAGTPWKRLEHLMLLCADPKVKVRKLEFGLLVPTAGPPRVAQGVTTPYELPMDRGIGAIRMKTATLEVRLVWKLGQLHWELRLRGVVSGPNGPIDDAGLRDLKATIQTIREGTQGQWLQAQLEPVGAVRRALHYGLVRKLLATLTDSAVDEVLITNTPPRRQR